MSSDEDTPHDDAAIRNVPDKIVQFRRPTVPRYEGKMVLAFKVNKPGCAHESSLIVDVDGRFVECDECGARLDAWDVVLRWAKKDLDLCRRVGTYERMLEKLKKECADMEKKKKSLEASIRRLNMRLLERPGEGCLR